MPAPVNPSQFCESVPANNSDLCTKVSKFFGIAQLLCDFFGWFLTGSAISDEVKTEITAFAVPTGSILLSATTNMGDGYLLCNGQAVSRTQYAALFSSIGTRYGTGDGTTTFNLPDIQGRSPIGAGTGDGLTFRDISSPEVGEEKHLQTVDEMPSHAHDPRSPAVSFLCKLSSGGAHEPGITTTGTGYRTDAVDDTGGGQAFNVVHPCFVLFYHIKT